MGLSYHNHDSKIIYVLLTGKVDCPAYESKRRGSFEKNKLSFA